MAMKVQRPIQTTGRVVHKTVGCGELIIQIAGDGCGHDPIEVFAQLGKSGECSKCQNLALSHAITLGLKYGVPPTDFVEKLSGHKCPGQTAEAYSCPDAIARALKEYLSANHQI